MRRVRFDPMIITHQLDDADENRRSSWLQAAVDRHRFRLRIQKVARKLNFDT